MHLTLPVNEIPKGKSDSYGLLYKGKTISQSAWGMGKGGSCYQMLRNKMSQMMFFFFLLFGVMGWGEECGFHSDCSQNTYTNIQKLKKKRIQRKMKEKLRRKWQQPDFQEPFSYLKKSRVQQESCCRKKNTFATQEKDMYISW